jgi:hypothetical protein
LSSSAMRAKAPVGRLSQRISIRRSLLESDCHRQALLLNFGFQRRSEHQTVSLDRRPAELDPDRVKTLTPGRQFMNFSRFSAFSTITGPAERKNSLQMRRFQTISEFSHGLDPEQT